MVKYNPKLDTVFKALAHPAGRTMLVRLANREATVSEPGQPADTRPPAVEGGEQHLATVEAYAEANPKSNRFL